MNTKKRGFILLRMGITVLACLLLFLSSGCDSPDGHIFVKNSGDDNQGTGSPLKPFKTIQYAIDQAESGTTICIAAGTYNESITLKNGVSLYGGFSALNWKDRDNKRRNRKRYKTVIRGTDHNSYVVIAKDNITRDTVIDGFHIIAGLNTTSPPSSHDHPQRAWGVHLSGNASPTISNNTIYGGHGEGLSHSYGIMTADFCSPLIKNNDIHGGAGIETSAGILLTAEPQGDPNPVIVNNVIDGGKSNTMSHGIGINASNAKILNNTITGGSGNKCYGIYDLSIYHDNGQPIIENNLIFTSGGEERIGICFNSSSKYCRPEALRNNDIFNCPNGLFRYYSEGFKKIATIDELNDVSEDFQSSGNISAEPHFISNTNFRLKKSSPIEVRAGARDLTEDNINFDHDGIKRTIPWSIGAFERD